MGTSGRRIPTLTAIRVGIVGAYVDILVNGIVGARQQCRGRIFVERATEGHGLSLPIEIAERSEAVRPLVQRFGHASGQGF